MRIIRKLITAAILAISPVAVRATASCDQFKAAMIEGAAQYQAPGPKFSRFGGEGLNSDPNIQHITIVIFDDTPALMSCWYGQVTTFAVDARSTEPMSILHAMVLAGMGLHGYGLEWRQALETRDRLVSLAKTSDRQMSEVHVEGGKASLIISVAGLPSFEIDTDR